MTYYLPLLPGVSITSRRTYYFLDPLTAVWMILTFASLLRKYGILSVTVLEPASELETPAASPQHCRKRQVKVRRTPRSEWRARLYRWFRIGSATLVMINVNKQTKLFGLPMCDRAATTTTARHSRDRRGAFEADRLIVWCGGAGPPAARAHRRGRSVATMLTSCAVVVLVAALATTASGDIVPPKTVNTWCLPADQFYIDKIFDKYGDKGVITFQVSV